MTTNGNILECILAVLHSIPGPSRYSVERRAKLLGRYIASLHSIVGRAATSNATITPVRSEQRWHEGPELLADAEYTAAVADFTDSDPADELRVESAAPGAEPGPCQQGEES